MKRAASFLICLSWVAVALAQNTSVDSLKRILDKSTNEKRVEVMHELVKVLWFSDPGQALMYGREAIRDSEKIHSLRLKSISLRLVGATYNYMSNYDSALIYTKAAHLLASGDSTMLANTFNNLGLYYYQLGSNTEALENLFASQAIKEKLNIDYGRSNTSNNLGLVYTRLKDYKAAEKYFIHAMEVSVRLDDKNQQLYTSNCLGLMHLQQGNVFMAEEMFTNSVELAKVAHNKLWGAAALRGLAQTHFSFGSISNARQDLRTALSMSREINDLRGIAEVYYHFARIHLGSGDLDSALFNIWRSNHLANRIAFHDQLLENFKLLKQLHSLNKHLDSAFHYQALYINLRNRQFDDNSTRKFADIQLKIQEEENAMQLARKNAVLEGKTIENYFLFTIAALVLILAAIAGVYYYAEKRLIRRLQLRTRKLFIQKEEIERKNNRLQSLSHEKNNLIAIVAHDLKSPLNHIRGLINIIKLSPCTVDKETTGCIEMIENSATRLTHMITKILDVEAIESKKLNLTLERINLSAALTAIVARFGREAELKCIRLHASVDDQLHVVVDKGYFEEVIENLLSNAIKFSPQGKNIFVNLTSENNAALCEVRDEGPGLSEDDQQKLFKKYQRLSATPTGNESSTGLGLSIVKKFVNAMKGQIWCKSEAGNGASFFVKFELAS